MTVLTDDTCAGGVGHAGERALVTANVRRLLGRFTLVKVKSEKKPVKWVINSWDNVSESKKAAAPKTKKQVPEKKKPVAKKPAAEKK